jgi:hypothetical protein
MSKVLKTVIEDIEFERLVQALMLEGVPAEATSGIRPILDQYVERRVERALGDRKTAKPRRKPAARKKAKAKASRKVAPADTDTGIDPYLKGIMERDL